MIQTEIIDKLMDIARKGPIPSVNSKSSSISFTLYQELGMTHSVKTKSLLNGAIISVQRKTSSSRGSRVNLFAQVPKWEISRCKSSLQILNQYGYPVSPTEKKLFCTVNSLSPNNQGLILSVDAENFLLNELYFGEKIHEEVVCWKMIELKHRMEATHPETYWIKASTMKINGKEYFHYTDLIYTGKPNVDEFEKMLIAGVISIDHLISGTTSSAREKGPLFKIFPDNFSRLFPVQMRINLI
jgi:hypothetical protein